MEVTSFAHLCGGNFVGPSDLFLTGFSTDSREVQPGHLFLAIKGGTCDGHDFVPQASERGAIATLAERPVSGAYIQVEKIETALANFGKGVRSSFGGPVIGITGSAGKTTTKEFVAVALGVGGAVLKSPGNRNTEFTSPLLWADLTSETRFAVVEMAMRGFGQIAHLAEIASPTIGIVTNIGYSHLLQVGDRHGIARAKGELLESLPLGAPAILWAEDDFFGELAGFANGREICTFGYKSGADCQVKSYRAVSWSESVAEGICNGEPWRAALPALGRHIALDAASAILTATLCGISAQDAADALGTVILPPMRMETRSVNGATILLDTYNASPPSMLAAIESLGDVAINGRRLAILGQMLELGECTELAHASVGDAVDRSELDQVLFVGESMTHALSRVSDPHRAQMACNDETIRSFVDTLLPGDVLLVKGSRALQLERLIP